MCFTSRTRSMPVGFSWKNRGNIPTADSFCPELGIEEFPVEVGTRTAQDRARGVASLKEKSGKYPQSGRFLRLNANLPKILLIPRWKIRSMAGCNAENCTGGI